MGTFFQIARFQDVPGNKMTPDVFKLIKMLQEDKMKEYLLQNHWYIFTTNTVIVT